eukprot:Skav224576  [mRNA]  locus=scaffold246:108473:108739:+ [translate_table: standard]
MCSSLLFSPRRAHSAPQGPPPMPILPPRLAPSRRQVDGFLRHAAVPETPNVVCEAIFFRHLLPSAAKYFIIDSTPPLDDMQSSKVGSF